MLVYNNSKRILPGHLYIKGVPFSFIGKVVETISLDRVFLKNYDLPILIIFLRKSISNKDRVTNKLV
jgi:hypothetical protein